MIALVIGGTRGFGREISKILSKHSYEVIVIGRSKSSEFKNSYVCDIYNLKKLRKILIKIQEKNKVIDLLACIVGFAEAKKSKDLTKKDWEESRRKNVTYVKIALGELTKNLNKSKEPKVITIGSQWSYKTGLDELTTYISAKHELKALTEEYASKHSKIVSNHYCVPTMNTLQYKIVRKSFKRLGEEEIIQGFMKGKLADYKVIARSLVNLALKTKITGKTFIIDSEGNTKELVQQINSR